MASATHGVVVPAEGPLVVATLRVFQDDHLDGAWAEGGVFGPIDDDYAVFYDENGVRKRLPLNTRMEKVGFPILGPCLIVRDEEAMTVAEVEKLLDSMAES